MNELHEKPQLNIPVVSGSALIADFMDIKEIESSYDSYGQPAHIWYASYLGYRTPAFSVPNKSVEYLLNESKFNSSWDWLLPVLEKLCRKEIGDGIEYVKYATPRTFGMLNEETGQIMVRLDGFQLFQADTLIEATFLAIVDCLQWLSQADR